LKPKQYSLTWTASAASVKSISMAASQSNGNGEPQEGIWYYVWLKPDWVLLWEYGTFAQHISMWSTRVIPALVEHYELTSEQSKAISGAYTGMPRGRVVSEQYGKKWRVVHGDDFPKGTRKSTEVKQIIGVFGLSSHAITGRVSVEVHEHEKMSGDHKARLRKSLGRIPYK
jgi:hypothetical protein